MIIPESISIAIIANATYDLLKYSANITIDKLKSKLQRSSFTHEEEQELIQLISLINKIPQDIAASEIRIKDYLQDAIEKQSDKNQYHAKNMVINNGNNTIYTIFDQRSTEKKNI